MLLSTLPTDSVNNNITPCSREILILATKWTTFCAADKHLMNNTRKCLSNCIKLEKKLCLIHWLHSLTRPSHAECWCMWWYPWRTRADHLYTVIHNYRTPFIYYCEINSNEQNFTKLWLQFRHALPHWKYEIFPTISSTWTHYTV